MIFMQYTWGRDEEFQGEDGYCSAGGYNTDAEQCV